MDLDLLHSFVSVVDAGGFTAAGERVHRSQSTVSQQIRKLEESLDCALFVREGRQVSLTEDGERLLGYARRMLALSTEVREAVSGRKRVDVIRLGIPDDFAADSLAAVISEFARSQPGVRLSVRCDLTAALVRGLETSRTRYLFENPDDPRRLGLDPDDPVWASSRSTQSDKLEPVVDGLVQAMLTQRSEARARKDWATADSIRDVLTHLGLVIEDTPDGARWSLD